MDQITSASPSMQLTRFWYFTSYPGILLISILKPIQNKVGESGLSLPTFLLNNHTAPLSVGESSFPAFPLRAVLPMGSWGMELRRRGKRVLKGRADCNTITYPFHAVFLHKERATHKRPPLSLNNHGAGACPGTFLNLWAHRAQQKHSEQKCWAAWAPPCWCPHWSLTGKTHWSLLKFLLGNLTTSLY